MLSHSLPTSNLSRSCPRLHNNGSVPPSTKTYHHCGYLPSHPCSREWLSEDSVHVNWTNEPCITNRDLGCTTSLQGYSTSTPASSVTSWAGREIDSPLDPQAQNDLEWWVSESSYRLNGCPIQLPPINLTVWSDASKQGWGAAYQGISTGGHWSVEEARCHINVLELRAATLALKAFLQSQDPQHPPLKHIHLRIDNTTALAYINKKGGTRSPALTAQALELWAVALTAGVSLTAQHIPGIQNVVADAASRQIETRTEWTLDRKIFQSICQRFYTPEVDLFASRLSHEVPKYVSRYPDPGALAVDAFLQNWSKWTCLIHPPVVLLPRVLRKIKEDRATAVPLIAQNWTGQPWFPDLIQMLVDRSLMLPQRQFLLFLPFQPTAYHPLWKSLHLTVLPLSGAVTKYQAFQRKLLTSCWLHGERPPRSGTQGPGGLRYAGVLNGAPVPFQLL